nr:MAG: ORF1 [TTV-like mini virus]
MPAYWKRYRRYPRRRRYWNWTRRPRKTFWRRYRTYRTSRTVSNNRRPITLKQWQPPFIKPCKIKGRTALILYNQLRLGFNSVMYEESVVPNHWPGGGSFSVTKYTLNALFSLHEKCRNWWTGSNIDLPLCRYKGCSLKFYQCKWTDYVVKIQTELPPNSNKLTYPSCQPAMMLMSSGKLIIPSEQTKKLRKGYKKVFVKPTPQLQNKWYFQVDLFNTPLMTIHASACNLKNYFLKPDRHSNNVTFTVLNTFLVQNRNMGIETTAHWPYKHFGTLSYYFYMYEGSEIPNDTSKIKLGNLIPLTDPRNNKPGFSYNTPNFDEKPKTFKEYTKNWLKFSGNPFNEHNLQHQEFYMITTKSPEAINTAVQTKNLSETSVWENLDDAATKTAITQLDEPIFYKLQYNPHRDTGQDTQFYLLSNKGGDGWDPPSNDKLILEGYPMWLGLFGFLDFQIKQKILTNIDINQILVIKSNFTQRPHPTPIVPINTSFTLGHSPYEQTCLPPDKTKWYPQVQYQTMELYEILNTGPGTPFLPETYQENIQMFYKFHFLWGGSPPKHVQINDPSHQITYPITGSEHETTSLQSPGTAPESVMYSFDFRHGSLTEKAFQRISQDWGTQPYITSITDSDTRIQLQKTLQELQQKEEQEIKEEEKVYNQLKQLKQCQQSLRQRIMCLLQSNKL